MVPIENIEKRIFVFRGRKVMIDRDLADLYDVKTKVLNQAVRRNIARFPEDFMFQLSAEEARTWRSQSVTSTSERMGTRYYPIVFTEQGVAMLSSVLSSERAVQVNIQIMRAFTRMREMLTENDHLRRKIETMEKYYDEQFKIVFETIKRMLDEEEINQEMIGFETR